GIDADIRTHDDGAGTLVDDDAGHLVCFDLQLLDGGHETDDVVPPVIGDVDLDGTRIHRAGRGHAGEGGNGLADTPGGGQIRVLQCQPQHRQRRQLKADFALDDGAVGDAAGSRHAAGDLGGGALGAEAGNGNRTLGDGIDLAIGAEQRGDQQGAALQALGIAHGRNGDVDAAAMAGEGGQHGGNHHGGQVVSAEGTGVADVDAEALQHGLQALAGERGVGQAVTSAVQADHQAVADQHVVTDALEIGDVLDARAGPGGGRQGDQGGQ